MTRREKSDAQLDAEAEPLPVSALIAEHRARFRDDLHIPRLVSRQPPTSIDSNTGVMDEEPAAATGMSMSGRMLRYVSGDYGSVFPWSKAFWLLKVNCRRNHPHHRSADRPYWRGALCYQAVKLVVVGGEANGVGPLTAEQAGQVLKIDQIDQILVAAFRSIDHAVDDFRDRAEKRAREDAGLGPGAVPEPTVEQRHDQDGMHQVDCAKCRRNAA